MLDPLYEDLFNFSHKTGNIGIIDLPATAKKVTSGGIRSRILLKGGGGGEGGGGSWLRRLKFAKMLQSKFV